MLFPHFYYKFYAKLKQLFKQCHNSLLGIPSPSKFVPSESEQKEHKYDWKRLRNSNIDRDFLSKIFFKWNIFPALTFTHNLRYCYFLYFLFTVFKLHGESEVSAKKHSNVIYIGTAKCYFLAPCTGEHTFMLISDNSPLFSSLIVTTAKNYQAYFVVLLVKFNKILGFQCSCLKKFHV